MPQVRRARAKHDRRYWLRILLWGPLATVTALVLFSGVTWKTPWRSILEGLGATAVFTVSIMPLCAVAMPRLIPFACSRLRFPFDWMLIVLVMIGLAMVGSTIAIFALTAVGYLPLRGFWQWFYGSLRASVLMTLIFGIAISALETMRARLAQASAEAQLASLESRVQPHFLFNTLNSIAALVHDDPARAEKMTTDLAALLRSSLDQQSTPLVPLAEELRIVRTYLDIERVRFGDRLRYRIEVDPSFGTVDVPRLSVQTLVENSVKYAVSSGRTGATIIVRAERGSGRLRVTVQDDGPGFDAASLPEGHGLALLRSRLDILFADRAAMNIEGGPGDMRVTLEVPA
jgi:signal transduction histidine kinase